MEIISFFAKATGHKVWITKLLNPFVWLGSLTPFGAFPPSHLGNAQASLALLSVWRRFVLQPINKMFATYYYDPAMSKYDFEYQLVSFEESLKRVAESLGK